MTADGLRFTDGVGYVIFWSSVESGVGIIAGSLPSIRKMFGHYFASTNDSVQRQSGRGGAQRTIGGTPFSGTGTDLQLGSLGSDGKNTTLVTKGGRGWEPLDDECSTRGIARHTTVRVEVESLSERESYNSSRGGGHGANPHGDSV